MGVLCALLLFIVVATVDKDELLKMQKEFHKIAKKQGNPNTVSREEFAQALKIVGVRESGTYAVCMRVCQPGAAWHIVTRVRAVPYALGRQGDLGPSVHTCG